MSPNRHMEALVENADLAWMNLIVYFVVSVLKYARICTYQFSRKKWLIKIIQEVYGIQVIDAYSCQKLSEELEKKGKISISYNTLRRLFGIIKGPTNASRFTLDSLSRGMGYSDFTAFQQAVNQFEKDFSTKCSF